MQKKLTEIRRNLNLNLEEQFQQLDELQSWPLHVTVATGQRCNLRCVFCADRGTRPKKSGDLTLDQFLQYATAMGKASRVQLYGWGEPFFNPNYEEILDYVMEHHPGTRIHISTNGTLLKNNWVDKLLSYGKCLINISLNAATAETYALVTQRNMFTRVVKNLRGLMQARERLRVEDFVVSASFVTIKTNIHELPRFIELCADLGVQNVKIIDLNIIQERHKYLALNENKATRDLFLKAQSIALANKICMDALIYRPVRYFMQNRNAYVHSTLPIDLQPVWSQGDKVLFYPKRGECYEPWQNFMVMHGGAVYTCCRGREVMGNLLENSFLEIWNGNKYRAYRRSINSFRPPEACRTCPVKMGYAAH